MPFRARNVRLVKFNLKKGSDYQKNVNLLHDVKHLRVCSRFVVHKNWILCLTTSVPTMLLASFLPAMRKPKLSWLRPRCWLQPTSSLEETVQARAASSPGPDCSALTSWSKCWSSFLLFLEHLMQNKFVYSPGYGGIWFYRTCSKSLSCLKNVNYTEI